MTSLKIIILVFLVNIQSKNVSDYVNILVGTGGQGFGIGSTPPGWKERHSQK